MANWRDAYRLYPWCPCEEKCGTQDAEENLCDTCSEVVTALDLATAKEQPRIVHSVIPPAGKHMVALDAVEPDGHIIGGTQFYFDSLSDAQKFIFFMCSKKGAEIKRLALNGFSIEDALFKEGFSIEDALFKEVLSAAWEVILRGSSHTIRWGDPQQRMDRLRKAVAMIGPAELYVEGPDVTYPWDL